MARRKKRVSKSLVAAAIAVLIGYAALLSLVLYQGHVIEEQRALIKLLWADCQRPQ
jgi:hypothetical protein